jgi:hypothetical protein
VPSDPRAIRALPEWGECEYPAFVSYAHADDTLAFDWVSQFRNELERNLRAFLRGITVPRLHLSADNGPIAGALGEQLRQRIEKSFAMIIVVHVNYSQSEWCLRELEVFRELFGEAGVRQRLYVLALSEPAMLTVAATPAWKGLMPGDDAVWLPFHEAEDSARPVSIYTDAGPVSKAFRTPFERLRDDLGGKIKASASGVARTGLVAARAATAAPVTVDLPLPAEPGPASPPAALPSASSGVRIYIESNRHEPTLWEPLGEQIQREWRAVCERLTPGRQPPLSLRARGLPVDALDRHPSLDDADGVILLWGRKTSDTLVAQIDKVERKTSPGRDAAPGIVAYLMPPQEASEPVPAWGWQVLRFDVKDEDAVDVLAEERAQLERFLRKVLKRRIELEAQGLR